DLVEGQAGEVLVEVGGGAVELGRRVGAPGDEQAVLHVAAGGDDDQQDAALGQADELELADAHRVLARRHHYAGELGELGEQVGGRADQALRLVRQQLAFEGAYAGVLERLHGQQRV